MQLYIEVLSNINQLHEITIWLGLGLGFGLGLGLLACNYAYLIVIIIVSTCNMCNKHLKIKCYLIFKYTIDHLLSHVCSQYVFYYYYFKYFYLALIHFSFSKTALSSFS